MIEPTDSQGYIWDPRVNRIAVIRVVSAIDPETLRIAAADWRALVRGACEAWEKSGVVAFTQTFGELDSADLIEGAVILKVHENPDDAWGGFTNPWIAWRNGLEHSALVWIDPDTTKDAFPSTTREARIGYIVCHELGHVLGLAHRPDSIMAQPGMEKRSATPTSGDLGRLWELYN